MARYLKSCFALPQFPSLLKVAWTARKTAFWVVLCVLLPLGSCVLSQAQISVVPAITTVAGNGTAGLTGDGGPATSAEVLTPREVVVDAEGDLYIAGQNNNRIREVNGKTGIITTVAGDGTLGYSGDGGPATSAELNDPIGIAVDAEGDLYIADDGNNRIREVNGKTGIITTVAGDGTQGYSGDGGPATSAELNGPIEIAVDAEGDLYIAGYTNSRIREVNGKTGIITTVAGDGTAGYSGDGGPATSAELNGPQYVAVDSAGNFYIVDNGNNRIREVNGKTGIITTVAGTGTAGYSGDGGPATSAELHAPQGVAIDGAGNLYIADSGNNRIREVNAATGVISTVAGNGTADYSGDGGPATSAELSGPIGVFVDSIGDLYIADTFDERIREVSPLGGAPHANFPTTAVGSSSAAQNVLIELTAAQSVSSITAAKSLGGVQEYTVGTISGCTVDGSTVNATDTICTVPITFKPAYPGAREVPLTVVTNTGTYKVALSGIGTGPQVALTPGTITTVAGNGTRGYSGDGESATSAKLNQPSGVAVDAAGDIYIAGSNGNRIREVNASTGVITTIAGDGTEGYSGDGGPATSAELDFPIDVAVDSVGDVYIADDENCRIREVNASTGIITTVAGDGTCGYSGDGGPATSAELSAPHAVVVDSVGNLYIADTGNQRIREVNSETGIITTVAGNGTYGYSGDGGPATSAELYNPFDIAVNETGDLYIADMDNNRVREVNAQTGTITTVAGDGTAGYSGDGGPATSAELYNPFGLTLDRAGDLYIGDSGNCRIREVSAATGIITTVAGDSTCSYDVENGDGGSATSAAIGVNDIALDSAGNLYVADDNDSIREVNVSSVPTLAFVTPTGIGQLDSTDAAQTVAVTNTGNMPLTFTVPGSGTNPSYPTAFPVNGSATNLCSSTASPLAVGGSCSVSFDFTPTVAGTNTGSIVLTDDAANVAGATQSISLSGTGVQLPAIITWATPAAITYGTALSATQLDATASVPGTFVYSPAAGAVLSPGTEVLSVTFTPTDTTDYSTATATVDLTVSLNPTMTQLSSSLNPSQGGQSVTLSALVSTGGAIPTGTVTFTDGGTTIGTASVTKVTTTNLIPDSDFQNGLWTSSSPDELMSGTGPDGSNAYVYTGTGSSSGAVFHTSPVITVIPGDTYTLSGYIDATQELGTLPAIWSLMNTNITVTYANATVPSGSAGRGSITFTMPAGVTQVVLLCDTDNVTVRNGGKLIFSEPQLEQASSVGPYVETGTSSATGSGGLATITDSTLPAGSDAITAAYGGDTNDAASSDNLTQTVTEVTPTVSAWPTAGGITYGESLASSTLTGGTASVAGTFAWTSSTTIPTATGTEAEGVTFTPTNTADYATVTGTVDVAVAKSSIGVTVSSSLDPSIYGDTVSYTFDFIGVAGMAVPTGEATITAGGTSIGTVTLNPSGEATLSISTLLAGTDTIKAVYGGDANYE